MATSAPSAMKSRAVARPMPLLPPVMSAFFPVSFMFPPFLEFICDSVQSMNCRQPVSGRVSDSFCSISSFNCLNAAYKRLLQNAPANRPEHEAEHLSLKVFAFAYNIEVNVGCAIKMTREGVSVAGGAAPQIGVGSGEDDTVGIGPVVMQPFPDATRALGDVSLRASALVHLEVFVSAVGKELRTARPEVGESGDVLFR